MKLTPMLLLSFAMFLLTACSAETYKPGESEFAYMEIDGMTCLYFHSGVAQTVTASVTCNWAEWNGKRDLVIKGAQP